jgi:hypothetical protein
MSDEVKKPKFDVIQNETPATPESAFDSAAYFKEAMKMRKPLQPVIKKVTVTVEVRVERPHPDTWFQLNPAEDAAMEAFVIKDKDRKYYFVTEAMQSHPLLYPRLKPVTLIEGAVWPPEVPYIVPFHHPDPDRELPAYTSAWHGYEQAKSGIWTQLRWNGSSFDVSKAENNPHPPTFSGKPMWELLSLAFKNRIITDVDHPYVKEQLRGVVN